MVDGNNIQSAIYAFTQRTVDIVFTLPVKNEKTTTGSVVDDVKTYFTPMILMIIIELC